MLGGKCEVTLTNIYPIKNLAELSCEYRLYRVIGLSEDSREYEKNCQKLLDTLRSVGRCPAALVRSGEDLFVAQPLGFSEFQKEVQLVRENATLELLEGTRKLDFGKLSPENVQIAVQFLKFSIEGDLFRIPALWRPSAGLPFFHKIPDPEFSRQQPDVNLFRGFRLRLGVLPNNQIGIAVDTSFKYLGSQYLPTRIDKTYFPRLKGKKCIYEFGNRWYEVTIEALDPQIADKVKLPSGKTLYEEVQAQPGQKSPRVLSLPRDSSVLMYYTKFMEPRKMPSSLCRLTYETSHPSIKRYHGRTIRKPDRKKEEIDFVVSKYLCNLKFGQQSLVIGHPIRTDTKKFGFPRLLFGNDTMLTTDTKQTGTFCTRDQFPNAKRDMLLSPNAGFLVKKKFENPQYFVIPKSVQSTYGNAFLNDIKQEFARVYGNTNGVQYEPTVLTYDDSVPNSIPSLGREIIGTIETNVFFAGYALIMIPTLSHTGNREDELANLLMRQLRTRQVRVSIIHRESSLSKYVSVGEGAYRHWARTRDRDQGKRLNGYLFNVVLNKILIANNCWPFALADGLRADLTIGIDVKSHTAGFTFFYGDGKDFRRFYSESEQSEQLSKAHMRTKIKEYIEDEQGLLPRKIQHIVIQRDGKFFPGEREGVLEAMDELSKAGMIANDYDCNVVEIKKTSSFPVRFFETATEEGSQREGISNPDVGTYEIFGNDGYLATTGLPYHYPGTARPIHVVKLYGNMRFEDILHDIFDLSNLTFTRIEFCSRLPLTIKMADLLLKEVAGKYDKDALNFEATEASEVE
jgi:hypothetical protein